MFPFPEIPISISMSKSEFRFRFRYRNFDFDFEVGIPISVAKISYQDRNVYFSWNILIKYGQKVKGLFTVQCAAVTTFNTQKIVVGISIPTIKIEIGIPINFYIFDRNSDRNFEEIISVPS
jgi:hypothetical protein